MRLAAALVLLFSFATPALAGMRATYTSPGGGAALVVEVADNGDARIGEEGASDYGLLIGGLFYVVGRDDTGWTVARSVDIAAAIDTAIRPIFGDALTRTTPPAPAVAIRFAATGPREIGGRRGTAYTVTGLDHRDPAATTTYVLSDDPALRPVGRALEQFMHTSLLPSAVMLGGAAPERIEETRLIFSHGTPLDAGGRFQLRSAETAAVPAGRLALPTPAKTRAELTDIMRRLAEQAQEEAVPAPRR